MSNFQTITPTVEGLSGSAPQIWSAVTTDSAATVEGTGYLNDIAVKLGIKANDVFFINTSDASTFPMQTGLSATLGQYQVDYAAPNWSLVVAVEDGFATVNLPTVADNIAVFSNTSGNLEENLPNALNNYSTSSATPGTVRSIIGQITQTATTMTSGNIVGVRGVVNYVGASAGFIYGCQGKVIPTGTLSGSEWSAGVFGQLDISAATINAGQIAPIWGDYGATSGTLTDQTGTYGIAMTNTTAVVTQGQIYLYGGSQNLLYLSTNAGLSGVTYFKDSGTGSGSWGNATPPTPSKVLKISVDGTAYYLPLVAQNT